MEPSAAVSKVPHGNNIVPDWQPVVTTVPTSTLSRTSAAATPGAAGAQAGQIQKIAQNQDHLHVKPQVLVQIPVFNDGRPESIAPPEIRQEVKPHRYKSSACHLGQHSYGGTPMYTPNQEMVDRSQWHDDPFYGWRKGSEKPITPYHHSPNSDRPPEPPRNQHQTQTVSSLGGHGCYNGANDALRKHDDPFAGWLPDKHPRGPPPDPVVRANPFQEWAQQQQSASPSEQDRFAKARLASLPSFSCAPLSRFDDGTYDYDLNQGDLCEKTQAAMKIHQQHHNIHQQYHDQARPAPHPTEQWKHDAFYGWLPQRGHEVEQQPQYRPLDLARNARLPSFSEAGLASRACSRADSRCSSVLTAPEDMSGSSRCGILTVRIIAAYNLINADTGIFGDVSDPYVKVQLGDAEKRTHTINNDVNPKWNSHPFLFDVKSKDQVLRLSVWDEDTLTADDPLGKMEIPLEGIISKAGQPIALRDSLWDVAHGELEVELSFAHG